MRPASKRGPRVYQVADINRLIRGKLERAFPDIWVEGEVTNVKRAPSGHLYIDLGDERVQAQLSCVMYASDARHTRARIERGARLRLRGRLSLYEPRGGFQLIVRVAVAAGEGDLRARMLELQRRLAEEGLFAEERKRELPRLPRTVGVVTSLSGAALQDVLRVSARRCPVRMVVADCRVQGEAAVPSILSALRDIQALPELDAIIMTRGGGSAEDLWSFNDERVVRAVADCRVPIVVGIGHETDVSLSELAADARAATPSQAAELLVPERDALVQALGSMMRRLQRAQEVRLDRGRLRLTRLEGELPDPRRELRDARDALSSELRRAQQLMERRLSEGRDTLRQHERALSRHDPRARLAQRREQLAKQRAALARIGAGLTSDAASELLALRRRLDAAGPAATRDAKLRFGALDARLDAMSPLRVLDRGYAIATDAAGRAVREPSDVAPGDTLTLRVAGGTIRVQVLEPDEGATEDS